MGSGQMGPGRLGFGQMGPGQMGTRTMYPGQIGPAQMEAGSNQKVAPLECEVEPLEKVNLE